MPMNTLPGPYNPGLDPFMEQLGVLYQAMDEAYRKTADHYGSSCKDCAGSCCRYHFFHYTVAEYLYLIRDLQGLSREEQNQIRLLAHRYVAESDRLASEGQQIDLMCPLNEDGLCSIYPFRPMICRLHGVPHFYRRPDMLLVQGDGCPRLIPENRKSNPPGKLDRTPFYKEMAVIEKKLRQEIGFTKRVKMTIADMILAF